jgi:glycosyltransferase involved in cell wall biosynthesis
MDRRAGALQHCASAVMGVNFAIRSACQSDLEVNGFMRTEPLFSAIIIFYNAERFLREAIDSVLNQTEESWELLLVDDGSRDGGADIAREYADRIPAKIRYLQHPDHGNHGMSATRNLGVRNSRGEWIAFLDADDIWLPTKLAEQKALLLSHTEAGLLYGSFLYWFSWSSESSRSRDYRPGVSVPANTLVYPPDLMLLNYPLGKGPAPSPSDLVVRRCVIDQVGGFEESFSGMYQLYEDQAFLAKAYLTTPAFVSGECWTYYRQTSTSCSAVNQAAGNHHEIRRFFLEHLERYLAKQNYGNQLVWRALKQALWPYRHPHWWRINHLCRRVLRRSRSYLSKLHIKSDSSLL